MANSYWIEELSHGAIVFIPFLSPHGENVHFFSIITISIKEGSSIFRNVDVQKQSYQE